MEQGNRAGVREQASVWVRVVLVPDRVKAKVKVTDTVAGVVAGEPVRAKDVEAKVGAAVSFTKY